MATFNLPRTKTPTEKFRISVDFKNDVKVGDTLNSHAVTAKRVDTGVDATATFVGTVVRSGTVVEAVVQNGTDGVDYAVIYQVGTTQGDTFQGAVVVPVRAL